ncbi:MAG: ester cyclase [Rhizobiaceae bacterium]|nr:ester cyclase [Rhizobiaceae bacterium]
MTSHSEASADVRGIVLAYVEAMNAGDLDRLRSLFADDCEIQGVVGRGAFDAVADIWRQLHSGLNMYLEVQSIVCEGKVAAARYVERGRWTGPFLGFTKPTGNSYELVAIEWFEVEDGRIRRRWGARDSASQARQVGFPEAAKPLVEQEEAA